LELAARAAFLPMYFCSWEFTPMKCDSDLSHMSVFDFAGAATL
jgi:hypothetical protein